jgi:dephospho-CoA kinase
MLKIGITGGIGTGKSLVCRLFALLNIPVYDSDLRAKEVMHNPELKKELIAAFGPETFDAAGLNRTRLAGIVFNNPEKLALLNSLVHPRVKQDFIDWYEAQQNVPYVLKEAALMFETEAYRQVDKMITVFAPLDIRMKRLHLRDTHRTKTDLEAIIAKQLPEEEKLRRADYVIYNDDTQLVIPQVVALHGQLLNLAGK